MKITEEKRELYADLVIAGCVLLLATWFLVATDFFEWWFEFTRKHEHLELDELLSLAFATPLAISVISIRHIFVINRVRSQLEQANQELAANREEKMRTEKMTALCNLAGGLAHELNNALHPVMGLGPFISGGLEKSGNTKHLGYMNLIIDSATHAQGIIENVLLISHEKSMEFKTLNAYDVIKGAVKFSADILGSTTSYTTHGIPESSNAAPVYIQCNKTGIYQIFYNLLKNASLAMDEKGEVSITITQEVMNGTEDTPALCINIADTGCGMDEETISKIFDPFFSTKDISEGTGLGLPTTHTLVETHGGQISVESKLGEGSSFTLFFPIIGNTEGSENNDDE